MGRVDDEDGIDDEEDEDGGLEVVDGASDGCTGREESDDDACKPSYRDVYCFGFQTI